MKTNEHEDIKKEIETEQARVYIWSVRHKNWTWNRYSHDRTTHSAVCIWWWWWWWCIHTHNTHLITFDSIDFLKIAFSHFYVLILSYFAPSVCVCVQVFICPFLDLTFLSFNLSLILYLFNLIFFLLCHTLTTYIQFTYAYTGIAIVCTVVCGIVPKVSIDWQNWKRAQFLISYQFIWTESVYYNFRTALDTPIHSQ